MNVYDLANISLFVLAVCVVIAAGAGVAMQRKHHSIAAGVIVLCTGIAASCIVLWCVWAWMPTLYATAPYDSHATTLSDMFARNLWVLPSASILAAALAYAVYWYNTATILTKE